MGGELERLVRSAAKETFSRSGGPGGQNVNKVSTQVTLHVRLSDLGLTEAQHSRLFERLGTRISGAGELVVRCSGTRSQAANREIALERAVELIESAIRPVRPRRPTRPSRTSVERRLEGKRRRSAIKRARGAPEE